MILQNEESSGKLGKFHDAARAAKQARRAGQDFENLIEASFPAYANALGVFMAMMPVPMAPTGQRDRHNCPLYRPKGKTPFDVYGYRAAYGVSRTGKALTQPESISVHDVQYPHALFVGAELKSTGKPGTSLAIVAPGVDGSGIEFHQLDALAALAQAGGLAYIVWSNAGDVGVVGNKKIVTAHATFLHSLESERAGRGRGRPGCRSISWNAFEPVNYATGPAGVYLNWMKLDGL